MRKLLIILLFIPFLCSGQFDMINGNPVGSSSYRGVWGIGANANITTVVNNFGQLGNGSNWLGYHTQINWEDIETSDNVFDWTLFDNKVNQIKALGLYVGVQLWVGQGSPSWLKTLAGSFTTTSSLTYPRYYNPVYMTRYYRILRKFTERCAFLGGILTWQISEGTTGDAGAYHGTLITGIGDPFVPQTEDGDDWEAFKHVAWDSVMVDYNLYNLGAQTPYFHLMFNTGNNAENVDLIASGRYGNAWGKKGDASHEYVFMGEGLYITRPKVFSRGECEDSILIAPHPSQNYYMQTVVAASQNLQLDVFNTPNSYYTSFAGTDTRFGAFFNRYANDTIAETSRHAFIKLGLMISVDSTSYWSEATYGNLISNPVAYNNAINNINSSTDSPSHKAFRRMFATQNFTNPTRITNLQNNTGTTAINGLSTNPFIYSYNNDFTYSGTQNWSKFITENNPATNSFPLYRIGPDTALYGRFAKRFTATNLMSFDISENWNYGAVSAMVNFTIAYLNSGTDSWSVQVYNSSGVLTTVATQTNTNTGRWAHKTFSTTMFFRPGEDFRLLHTAGSNNVIFDIIELNADVSTTATGAFNFTLPSDQRTSAGVFKSDSTLVRTLWADSNYSSGTHTEYWDGKDDYGNTISSPDATYTVKVLSSNVTYNWDGIIGNTSSSKVGTSVHRGYYFCMLGMAFAGTTAYFCQGYSEAYASEAKLSTSNPQVRLDIFPGRVSTMASIYVATDGTNVYWAGYDASVTPNISMVHATKVSDDSQVSFSSGTSYTITGIGGGVTYTSVIDKITTTNSRPTGLAVQTSGNYLFVSHGLLNQLHVLNKTTGALVQNISVTNAGALAIDGSSLWMVSSTNTVAKYTINGDGSLTAATLILAGISTPNSISVSGSIIAVTDAGTNHIVRFFNTTTGVSSGTLGTVGSYNNSPTVTNTKFYFSNLDGITYSFVSFAPDGSYWVGDVGNQRAQHFSSGNSFIETVMSQGSVYSVCVDPNNINRMFIGFSEYAIDYSQPITGSTGWTLAKNYGYGQPNNSLFQLQNVVTLSNGRTYGNNWATGVWPGELVEITSTGLRTTTQPGGLGIILNDGTLQKPVRIGSGNQFTVTNYPLTGFNGSGDPQWSASGTLLTTTPVPTGNNIAPSEPTDNVLSSTNKVIFYDTWNTEVKYHLGALRSGTNTWLWQTQHGDRTYYEGAFPGADYYEAGNGENEFAGSRVNVIDNNIISGHHGEFWKNLQTNYYNHYLDDGLVVGQFGTDLYVSGTLPAIGNAGNALTPQTVKDVSGDLYLYHGDESLHGGAHRWTISNLSSIQEQSVIIPFPSDYVAPTLLYTDLNAGLPLHGAVTTVGWSTTGTVTAITGTKKYIEDGSPDVRASFDQTSGNASVQRDLGTNNVANSWSISGQLSFEGSDVGAGGTIIGYVDVLDATGKILSRFYYTQNFGAGTLTITANSGTVVTGPIGSTGAIGRNLLQFQPFTVATTNGIVTFTYANYAPITVPIFDASGNWRTPKTLRMFFTGGFPAYGKFIDLMDMHFFVN